MQDADHLMIGRDRRQQDCPARGGRYLSLRMDLFFVMDRNRRGLDGGEKICSHTQARTNYIRKAPDVNEMRRRRNCSLWAGSRALNQPLPSALTDSSSTTRGGANHSYTSIRSIFRVLPLVRLSPVGRLPTSNNLIFNRLNSDDPWILCPTASALSGHPSDPLAGHAMPRNPHSNPRRILSHISSTMTTGGISQTHPSPRAANFRSDRYTKPSQQVPRRVRVRGAVRDIFRVVDQEHVALRRFYTSTLVIRLVFQVP
jgi:hypothetical protein